MQLLLQTSLHRQNVYMINKCFTHRLQTNLDTRDEDTLEHQQNFKAHINRNCLGRFREIPWNQTTDVHVHQDSTLKTRVIT